MTRELGARRPTNLTSYLKDAKLPATKDALIRQAIRDGADAEVIGMLEAFPDEKFKTMAGRDENLRRGRR